MPQYGKYSKTAVIIKRVACIIGIITAILLITPMVLCDVCVYCEMCHVATRCEAESPDGEYTLLFKSIGQPPWPYGDCKAKLELKRGSITISETEEFGVGTDGGMISEYDWEVTWTDEAVQVVILGEGGQHDVFLLHFDGRIGSSY